MTFNKQGRAVSDTMRLNSFKAYLKEQQVRKAGENIEYRGHIVHRAIGGKHCSVKATTNGFEWPMIFASAPKAKAAIDRCWRVREEVK